MPMLKEIDNAKEKKLSKFNISIKDCMVLCHVIDLFEEFTVNLTKFSKGTFGDAKLKRLYNFVKDEEAFVKRDIKTFYLENYKVLDAIHKYSYISNFLLIYFDRKNGEFNQEITQMYEYIKANKEDIDKILAVLDKLSKLGFEHIYFAENKQFDKVYEYERGVLRNYYYLDGEIEIIPCIENTKYKSKDANYEIEGSVILFYVPKITLNNLIFDPNNLPEKITYNETIGKVLKLTPEKKESCEVLADAVHFDYYLERIVPYLDKIDELIGKIHNCSSKPNAKKHIDTAKQGIAELQCFLANYEQDIIEQGLLTEEILVDEKEKYKRRYN